MSTNELVIETAGLHYAYHDGTTALRDISLRVHAGESVCIAGPNGAGKSTLLLCLAGLLKGEGKIRVGVDGRLNRVDPRGFGLVFQDPDDQLFCPTVGEDIAFGPRNERRPETEVQKIVHESLEAVGLAGYENRSGHHLSGGEKKRVAIASVLACRPEVIALDEPWADLDARASHAVTGILQGLGRTKIVVTQDLYRAAAVCERLVIMDQGTIAADGPMVKLLRDEVLLREHGVEFGTRCRVCPEGKGE
jgi:energy-coupling factor transporter ATP-binding protein EcfA2